MAVKRLDRLLSELGVAKMCIRDRYRVYSEGGEFLMLGRVQRGIMKTVKSFFEV